MPTALVTGSEGFLGRYIAAALAATGWQLFRLDRQPESRYPASDTNYHALTLPSPEVNAIIEATRPDAIVHAAGPASVASSLADPVGDFQASVAALLSVLDAARRFAPACRVLFLSSAAVYGNPARLPVGEDAPHRPLSPYGYHKSLCEQLLREYWTVYRLPCATLRLFSAYGPGLKRQVLWDICRQALESPEVELFGTGDESRDFVHAFDVGHAARLALERAPFEAEAYNVASGEETRIRDLAELIVREVGRGTRLRFTGQGRPGDPQRWQADLGRIGALGYAPSVLLERGVSEYVQWVTAQAGLTDR